MVIDTMTFGHMCSKNNNAVVRSGKSVLWCTSASRSSDLSQKTEPDWSEQINHLYFQVFLARKLDLKIVLYFKPIHLKENKENAWIDSAHWWYINIEFSYSLSNMPNYLTLHVCIKGNTKANPACWEQKKEMLRMLDHLLNTNTKGKAVTDLCQEKGQILKLVLQGNSKSHVVILLTLFLETYRCILNLKVFTTQPLKE